MADEKQVPRMQVASPSEKAFGEAFRRLFRNALVAEGDLDGQKVIMTIALQEWSMVARMIIEGGDEPILDGVRQVLAFLNAYGCSECGRVHVEDGKPVPHPADPGAVLH